MKLLEVEGARAPVPHSWRRHCDDVNVILLVLTATTTTMGARRIFRGVGKLGVWEQNSPGGPRDGASVEIWGRSLQKPTKGCESNA